MGTFPDSIAFPVLIDTVSCKQGFVIVTLVLVYFPNSSALWKPDIVCLLLMLFLLKLEKSQLQKTVSLYVHFIQ